MKEIYEMWRVVRLLKQNAPTWAIQLLRKDVVHNGNKRVLDTLKNEKFNTQEEANKKATELVDIQKEVNKYDFARNFVCYNKEPTVERKALVNLYLFTHYKEFRPDEDGFVGFKDINNKDLQQKYLYVESKIQSCIDEEHSFIKEEPGDKSHIYLSVKGKKFSDIIGLLKAWAKEIDILWAGFVWILSLIGAVNFKVIKDFILGFFTNH